MTDDQLNDLAAKIADSIFKRLVAKQQEWDEQFNEQMTEVSWGQMEYKEEDALRAKYKEKFENFDESMFFDNPDRAIRFYGAVTNAGYDEAQLEDADYLLEPAGNLSEFASLVLSMTPLSALADRLYGGSNDSSTVFHVP